MAAVKDFSFDLAAGEVLGIGGPNGAGKTTLFELISGLNPADSGEILLEGREIQKLPPHAICHMGIARMFQSNAGFDTLSARQNVLIAAAYGRKAPALIPALVYNAEIRRTADEAIEFVGYRHSLDAQVRGLPALDRKLLMIASALATKPRILMMDEPVGGLNPEEIDRLMALVRKLIAAGVTIMLIEHVMRFLVQLSTRVMIMHHGEKIYEGTPGGLAQDETVTRVYLGERMSKRIAGYSAKAAGR
jgi:branched-chain amino acid transport system ATP-binding protein